MPTTKKSAGTRAARNDRPQYDRSDVRRVSAYLASLGQATDAFRSREDPFGVSSGFGHAPLALCDDELERLRRDLELLERATQLLEAKRLLLLIRAKIKAAGGDVPVDGLDRQIDVLCKAAKRALDLIGAV